MRRILCAGAWLGVALMLSGPSAFSQNLTANISARAQDSSGGVIPGVEVSISSPAMIGGVRKEVTDETGVYRFTLLPPGAYRVSFSLPGFKTLNIDGVTLTAGSTQTVDGTMEVASTAEEITVSSQAATIDLESATVGVNWSQKMIDELPWSRSLTGISMMIPGTYNTSYDIGNSNFGTGSTIAARSGGRTGGNVVTIDGLIWCQTYSDYGSFEEMNISTNAKGADQMNSGITIAMVGKSGGNTFHGNFTTKFQNGSMQSNNIDQTLLDMGFPKGSNKYTHFVDYYGDIGGPIVKDKLWFYGAGRWGYQGTFIPGFVTGVGGQQTDFYTELKSPTAKMTYQITPKQKLEAYVSIPDKFQPYRGGNNLNPKDSTQDQDSWSSQGPVLTYTNILNSKTTFTAKISRGGYWWPAYAYGIPQGQGPNIFANGRIQTIPTMNWLGTDNVGVRITDTTTTATDGGYNSNYSRPIRWQQNFDVSRFAKIAGKNNELKVGYMGWWDKNYTINFGYPYAEQYRYKSTASEACPGGGICDGLFLHPNSVIVYDDPNNNAQGGKYRAAYVNDKITVNRKLTVNAGLRWDWATSFLTEQGNDGTGPWATRFQIPYETSIANPDGSVAKFPSYNLWSPRLSFAYDVFGNGKVAIKGSYGKYVGITSSPNSQPGPGANTGSVDPVNRTSCTYNNWDGTIPFDASRNFGPDGIMGTADDINLSASCGQIQRVNGQIVPLRTYNFDANLKSSYLNEYAAGVEIGLSRNYSIRFDVSRKFDVGQAFVMSPTAGTATATIGKTITPQQPYSAYTDIRCATDPGRDGVLGTTDDNPFGQVCTYSIPAGDPNRLVNNITYASYEKGEGVASYTGYDVTLNKNYANGWSLLTGYAISLAHPGVQNPLTPDQMLYSHNFTLTTWNQSLKLNGSYAIPLFRNKWYGGIRWASTFTAQSGDWLDRIAQVTNALGTTVQQNVDPHAFRRPAVSDWDQRITKRFKIGERQSIEVDWDLYNTLNSNTVTAYQSLNSGSSTYRQLHQDGTLGAPLRPSSTGVLAPRIYEFGVTYKF